MAPTYGSPSPINGLRRLDNTTGGANNVKDIDQILRDLVDDLEPEAWREIGAASQPAWATGWSDQGLSGTNPAAFYRHLGLVYLRGVASPGGGAAATIFTLPTGYRPDGLRLFAAYAKDGNAPPSVGFIKVSSAGVVSMDVAGGAALSTVDYVALDTVAFRIA